jgi:hypothetical protein
LSGAASGTGDKCCSERSKKSYESSNVTDFGKIILGVFYGTITALVGKGGLPDELP